jgi:hypothetical protein
MGIDDMAGLVLDFLSEVFLVDAFDGRELRLEGLVVCQRYQLAKPSKIAQPFG